MGQHVSKVKEWKAATHKMLIEARALASDQIMSEWDNPKMAEIIIELKACINQYEAFLIKHDRPTGPMTYPM